jgi:hypothetical protein
MSAHWTVGAQRCTTSARAATWLPLVCSSGGGLLRDCGHGTDRRRHQKAQQLPQNDNHEEEENNEEEEEEGNKAKGEYDEDYTPLSDAEKDEMFHDAEEIKTAGNEAPITIGRLSDLLNHLNITTHPEFRIKRVPHPGREEYKAIMEIFSGPNVLSHHKGPAFRATYQDAVADAAWQVITTYNRRYHEELKNTVYHLLPQRKKNKFRTSGSR